MGIYIVLLIVVGLCTLLFTNPYTGQLSRNNRSGVRLFYFIVFVLILIQGFRTNLVGGDLINYGYRFFEFGNMNWRSIIDYNAKYEIGYILLNKIVYVLSNGNFQVLLFVIAIFYNISLAVFLEKNSSNYFFSLYLYIALNIFNLSMNNLRSTVALGFLYIGLPYLFKRKNVKFLIVLVIACLFHTTMICMLFLFGMVFITNKYLFASICVIFSGFLSIGFSTFSRIIQYVFPKYDSYFMVDSSGGGWNLLLFLIFLLLVLLFISKKEWWESDSNVVLLKMLICGICLQIVSLNVSFFARAVYYHLTSILILYPELISNSRISKRSSSTFMFIIMVCFMVYYIVLLQGNSTMTVPYEWIFN